MVEIQHCNVKIYQGLRFINMDPCMACSDVWLSQISAGLASLDRGGSPKSIRKQAGLTFAMPYFGYPCMDGSLWES